jgi:hypothetical protein
MQTHGGYLESLSAIFAHKSDFHRSTRSSVRFNAACKYL